MLEKIGLPPKPSLRGNTWVVDASHCQGCSSPFTFINRKHHCRRCGGIFCNSCTQQRMILRGQGDSPVRICEPCKKLEEAARFEMRYGHKSKAAKGGSKRTLDKEDDILNQILGSEGKVLSSNERGSASSSNISHLNSQVEREDTAGSLSLDQSTNVLQDSITPEELRQQAVIEKNKYKTLKAEGKSEEALKAFKRGKELERQAGALEISLRKSRRKALSSTTTDDVQPIKDEKGKLSTRKSKENDDLSAELKDLGWSDLDLHDVEKKPATLTLEGELSSLIREVSQKPNKEKQTVSSNKAHVVAHKKKALELKRAGNLAEAKEELKRAKLLEKKIEEEELLGDADDSDDELSSLMRSMDADENDDLLSKYKSDVNFDFSHLIGLADGVGVDGNLEVTDEDMEDPEIASALKSLGWTEDIAFPEDPDLSVSSSNKESRLAEIKSLKTEAVMQKRAGNMTEAMALLKKAKALEAELESFDYHETADVLAEDSAELHKASISQSVISENINSINDSVPKSAPNSKLMVQKELIALKKSALSLRRAGKLDESEEELRKAEVLEQQLEDMNKAPTVTQPSGNKQAYNSTYAALSDGDEEEVTDQDMHDPTYLSLLKNLGWEDEQNVEPQCTTSKEDHGASEHISGAPISHPIPNIEFEPSRKSRSEIQRELLALKRKALTLRRQGEADEVDEVLEKAKLLETQLQEYEERSQNNVSSGNEKNDASIDAPQITKSSFPVDLHEIRNVTSDNQQNLKPEKPEIVVREIEKPSAPEARSPQPTAKPQFSSVQQDILAHKRKAVALKREGKLAEAKEELRQAKLLEKRMEENAPQTSTNSNDTSASDPSSVDKEASPSSVSKPLSSRDRFKLQQESLGHKRQALKLRREGKTAEADAEFELAKALESQLQELESNDGTGPSKSAEAVDVSIEDFLDPQLLFALQSIGLEAAPAQQTVVEKTEPAKAVSTNTDDDKIEREQLAERIKAEKVKAVNFKRSGKQTEALDALRRAKLYEKKLQSLNLK